MIRTLILNVFRFAFDLRSWRAGFKALRIPSLVIAAFSCALGIVLAYHDGKGDLLNAAAVMITGLLLQAGVNLVNDFFEFRQRQVGDKIASYGFTREDRDLLEIYIFLVGLGLFGAAGLFGLFLAWRAGWPVIVLGIVGFAGGFFYTGEPLNYKRRGLAVTLVFFIMGVLMVGGSYFAVARTLNAGAVLSSIPVSFLISLILLANELRDYESDVRFGVRTLTVRIGYNRGITVYCVLLACAYASPVALRLFGVFPHLRFVYGALPFCVPPFFYMRRTAERRLPIVPLVMLHHLAFGALYCVTFFVP
jgi:1,4-dihydroxy-2-naphthoate polyprenyltransferase